MESWQAWLLGVVEGLTEYLPISSTGHLLVCQRLLHLPATPAMNAFAVAIQAGAILAVLTLYRERCRSLAQGVFGRDEAGARLALRLAAAFLPAAILGLLFDDWIEARLFGAWPVVAAWIAGGVALVAVPRWSGARAGAKDFSALGVREALIIGLFQCAALWPGTSRSLATLVGALSVGLAVPAALEFSFLLGLLTLSAASAYKLIDAWSVLRAEVGLSNVAIGLAGAWFAAWLSVRWMVGFVLRRGLAPFGWYRIALGIAVAAWLLWSSETGAA